MTGTVEDGLSWLDFSVDLVMVFSSWVVKPQAMQLQTLFRFRLHKILFSVQWFKSEKNKQTNLSFDGFQALPLVSTFWGILLFGEYRRSSRRTYVLLISMLFMFIVAVAVLMASSGHRK